ncbi:FkbM family methyltransferase [Oleiagrimonas soli]|uniref:FkbM family methyltransferase n=1 Tax=Oleiagrimonas soli TaxID=1543381 RepID=A0A099CTE3_9GAMM|nr:FkbM family methyltransferase [Oleiagrimonas soli]KGI77248.1 methyltransferase FkbM [Oleiagrimonas soli]MBB6185563.1 FkbM family methyltransferase [Oleiagrimonas soli]
MNLQDVLDQTLSRLDRRSKLAQRFLESSSHLKRFAIGRNEDTLQLHRHIGIDGIIDDYGIDTDTWHGIPIMRTSEVPIDAVIANCSTSISPIAVRNHLQNSGFRSVVSLHELIVASNGTLSWPVFVSAQRKEMREHLDAWVDIYDTLADDVSRTTFLDVLRFRISADPDYMKAYEVRVEEQYFEDFMGFSHEVFVDAGGFDGDTSEAFAIRYPGYKKILLFEPSNANMSAARQRLSGFRDIDFHDVGLSDTKTTLHFDENAGSAASVKTSGTAVIAVDTLDALVEEPVTFIKMDLEGWECRALEGARRHIAEERPKLAIAIYHDAADARRIYDYILGFGHDYKVFLRHYTQGWSETIMFFV